MIKVAKWRAMRVEENLRQHLQVQSLRNFTTQDVLEALPTIRPLDAGAVLEPVPARDGASCGKGRRRCCPRMRRFWTSVRERGKEGARTP